MKEVFAAWPQAASPFFFFFFEYHCFYCLPGITVVSRETEETFFLFLFLGGG